VVDWDERALVDAVCVAKRAMRTRRRWDTIEFKID